MQIFLSWQAMLWETKPQVVLCVYRYYILGFNFNEKVRVNRESCQLLLERIGLTNWAIGKTKVRCLFAFRRPGFDLIECVFVLCFFPLS